MTDPFSLRPDEDEAPPVDALAGDHPQTAPVPIDEDDIRDRAEQDDDDTASFI